MEVIDVSQLPMDLGMRDRGYAVKVRATETWYTWNGEVWCLTVDDHYMLPRDVERGTHYYVGEYEYVYDGEVNPRWSPTEPVDMVNHPPHYTRGPKIKVLQQGSWEPVERVIECIEVIRGIKDGRLFTAMKYIWRVAFGGKDNDREDIRKSIWYLQDWLDNP
jgi:hypothetical protein